MIPSERAFIRQKHYESLNRQQEELDGAVKTRRGILDSPFESNIGITDYVSSFQDLEGGLPQVVNNAIQAAYTSGQRLLLFVDLWSSTTKALRQIASKEAPSLQIPQDISIEGVAIGLSDLRATKDISQDDQLGITVYESVLNTPARLDHTLKNALNGRKANLFIGRPKAGAISIIDNPIIAGMNANVLWQHTDPSGGTIILEFEYGLKENVQTKKPNLIVLPDKIRDWALTPHEGITKLYNPDCPWILGLVKTPDSPNELPPWN